MGKFNFKKNIQYLKNYIHYIGILILVLFTIIIPLLCLKYGVDKQDIDTIITQLIIIITLFLTFPEECIEKRKRISKIIFFTATIIVILLGAVVINNMLNTINSNLFKPRKCYLFNIKDFISIILGSYFITVATLDKNRIHRILSIIFAIVILNLFYFFPHTQWMIDNISNQTSFLNFISLVLVIISLYFAIANKQIELNKRNVIDSDTSELKNILEKYKEHTLALTNENKILKTKYDVLINQKDTLNEYQELLEKRCRLLNIKKELFDDEKQKFEIEKQKFEIEKQKKNSIIK